MGKTFLCFAVASGYALQHPDFKVVVIDMCPQANISEILLGGNGNGGEILQKLNRSTTYRKKPAKAFNKMYENIKDRVRKQRSSLPDSFTGTDDEVFIDMLDAHTVAIVASYQGKPIRHLRVGKYDLDGTITK